MIVALELDALLPEYLVRLAGENEERRRNKLRPKYIRFDHRFSHPSDTHRGFDPVKLLDWRRLERRTHALRQHHDELHGAFWWLLRSYQRQALEYNLKEVWIHQPNDTRHPDELLVFHDDSYVWRHADELIKDHLDEPKRLAFIVKDAPAETVHLLRKRSDYTHHRWQVYDKAFREAVEFRLKPFIKRELRTPHRFDPNYYEEATFTVTNDDRTYVITTDRNGCINWAGSRAYECT